MLAGPSRQLPPDQPDGELSQARAFGSAAAAAAAAALMTDECGDDVAGREEPIEDERGVVADCTDSWEHRQRREQETCRDSPRKEQPSAMHQMEHFTRIKQLVKEAIAARHTFMIHGRSRVVRESLLARGWCEKFHKRNGYVGDYQLSVDSNPAALLAGVGNLNERQNERVLISKMLGNHTVDFLWNAGSEWTGWPSQENKTTIFNRFTRANFTSKVGLCTNVRQMHWYYEAGIANTLFPRCYNLSQPDQMHAFVEDFRLTACLSLLKWLVDKVKSTGEESVRASSGLVPLRALDFAIGRCSDFIGSKSHEDIDQELEKVWSHQWEQFISWYYKLIHANALLVSNNVPIDKYVLAARHLLKKAKKFWPQLDMDGTMNIWILKPGNKSRGRGIVLMNKLDDMLAKVNPANKTTDTRFVVQKYIERPLLIYETKFDIRQWFIVTNAQPLILWMYRQSYLRFCSQKFSLIDFHESIHLSNNAVQCKYKNSPDRDAALPAENMWDVATFKEYLKNLGDGDAWDSLIYPGMKQGLVGSLLASQEAMDRRKNSFELYGADFMVMEDFSVWLIEINSHPDMSNSTSVTTRLCRKAMEDTIKVVVDYKENPSADTGDFELVYKQKISSCQAYLGTGLSLHGTRIGMGEKRSNTASLAAGAATGSLVKKKASTAATSATSGASTASILQSSATFRCVGPVLVDLIEELELQLDREFYDYLKLRSTNGLARQILPLQVPSAVLPETEKTASASQYLMDVQQSAIAKNVNLPTPLSQAAVLATNSTGDTAISPRESTKFKKSAKYKSSPFQCKRVDLASTAQQEAKLFVSKIRNLRKETCRSGKLLNLNSTSKSACSVNISDDVNSKNEMPLNKSKQSNVKEATVERQTDISSHNTSTSRKFTTPSKQKFMKNSRSALEANKSQLKRHNRSKSSKIFVDVNDLYAVGLAVKKK